eukprot:gene7677-10447_t
MLSYFVLFALLNLINIYPNPCDASPITLKRPPSLGKLTTKLLSPLNKNELLLSDILNNQTGKSNTLVVFFTHCGDLASFELAQRLVYLYDELTEQNIGIIGVIPGASISSAEKFCGFTKFPMKDLYIDYNADIYKYLEFNSGFLADVNVSPYLKLLPMLAGIGSKGTLNAVLKGYIGDRSSSPKWIRDSLRLVDQKQFNVLGSDYQRPFELATLRLQNMMDVLNNWNDLVPDDTKLLTQLGATYIVSNNGTTLYEYKDTGILVYCDVKEALNVVGVKLDY